MITTHKIGYGSTVLYRATASEALRHAVEQPHNHNIGYSSRTHVPSMAWDENRGFDGAVKEATEGVEISHDEQIVVEALIRRQRELQQAEDYQYIADPALAVDIDPVLALQGDPDCWVGMAPSDVATTRAQAQGVVVVALHNWDWMVPATTIRRAGFNAFALWRGLVSLGIPAQLYVGRATRHGGRYNMLSLVDLTGLSLPVIAAHLSPAWFRRIHFGIQEHVEGRTGMPVAATTSYGSQYSPEQASNMLSALGIPRSIVMNDSGYCLEQRLRKALCQ